MLRWNIKSFLAKRTKILIFFTAINWQISLYYSNFCNIKTCAWDSVDRNPLVLQKEISRVVCWVEPWSLILFIAINRQISFYYSYACSIKSCMLGILLTEIPRICWRKLVRLPSACWVEPWPLVGPRPLLPRPGCVAGGRDPVALAEALLFFRADLLVSWAALSLLPRSPAALTSFTGWFLGEGGIWCPGSAAFS